LADIGQVIYIYKLLFFSLSQQSERFIMNPYLYKNGDRGSTVVNVLCYKSEGPWLDPSPGVDSASNRNEYQEHFLGVKAAGA